MRIRTLAHLSDLHIGASAAGDRAAEALCAALCAQRVDHVVATGDITHRGRRSELDRFRALFAPLLAAGRLTVVPGNHDRWNDDISDALMPGAPVQVASAPGLHLVCVDSSGPHNRSIWISHGNLCAATIDQIAKALERAPRGALTALLLHHHLVAQPEESSLERLAAFLGWPDVGELNLGAELLARIRGRCDLVLHGHRHVPRALTPWPEDARPLHMFNAGSSTGLGRFRVFAHLQGQLLGVPTWRSAPACAPARAPAPAAAAAARRYSSARLAANM
ncbi:MAG TPA: metallophosphoesterase [Polyangia bacterium]|nr:metallophosphoesterase [Polyangia bacterium]